jgi:predicted ATPase
VGKTRLAIQVAEKKALQFKDGVWWVELASISGILPSGQEPHAPVVKQNESSRVELINRAIAKVLCIQETPGQPILEAILEHMRDKQLLMILDNCEHLIEACATLAEILLGNCPEITILTTSRESLGVLGEKAWLLPSLSLPGIELEADPAKIFQSEAVSLFMERTTDILPGYQPEEKDALTIAQICLRLDGIPLAIELAAARTNLLSVHEIAARLDDRFNLLTGGHRTVLPRHQTLRAAIEWSHDLLDEHERVLFRRLSVFAGSFTLEAAEAVCVGGDIQESEVLTLLGKLVSKSLLYVEPASRDSGLATRYRLLDTIHSFERLKLDEAGETGETRDRHAAYYVRLVEAAKPEYWLNEMRGIGLALMFDRHEGYYVSLIDEERIDSFESEHNLQNYKRWYKVLQAESDNIRAVIEWSAEGNLIESALRLVGGLVWYWYFFGSPREGRELALKALASPSSANFPQLRARALNTAGHLQVFLGEITEARLGLEEALTILRASDDEAGLAWTLQFLGQAYNFERNYEMAEALMKEGSAIARNIGALDIYSFSFYEGDVDMQKGDIPRAKKRYEESVEFQRVYGTKAFLGYPLRRLGYLALMENDVLTAWKYFQESLALNREVGDKPGVAACLTSMAALALHQGKPVQAACLCGVVGNRLASYSISLFSLDQVELERIQGQLHTSLDEATFEAAYSEGWEMSEEQAIELARVIMGGESKQ